MLGTAGGCEMGGDRDWGRIVAGFGVLGGYTVDRGLRGRQWWWSSSWRSF